MFADFQILFLSFCALQGFFLVACLFFIRNRNSPANILMMCLIAVICLFLFRSLLWRTELIYEYPHFLGVFWGWPLLIGPLLYFYTCSNTFGGIRFSLKQLLHFVPIIIIFLLSIPVFPLPALEKQMYIQSWPYVTHEINPLLNRNIVYLINTFLYIHLFAYCFLCIFKILENEKILKDEFSNTQKINLRWLKYVQFACSVAAIWGLIMCITLWVHPFSYEFNVGFIPSLFLSLIILYSGFASIYQPSIFNRELVSEKVTSDTEGNQKLKYAKSGLSSKRAEQIKQELIELMTEKKFYLDESLSVTALSEQLGIPKNTISQVINDNFGKNFHDFVNGYRIADAKKLLLSNESKQLHITDIAIEVGYNTKSSFYKAFKKDTGMTPHQFRKRQIKAT